MKIPKYFKIGNRIYKRLWVFKNRRNNYMLCYSTERYMFERIQPTLCQKCLYKKICSERKSHLTCIYFSEHTNFTKSNAIEFYLKKEV